MDCSLTGLRGRKEKVLSTHRCVCPTTDSARVHLGMLHRMRGEVHLERGCVCVRSMTVVALEGFIFVVLPSVGLRKLGEIGMNALDSFLLPASLTLMEKPSNGHQASHVLFEGSSNCFKCNSRSRGQSKQHMSRSTYQDPES